MNNYKKAIEFLNNRRQGDVITEYGMLEQLKLIEEASKYTNTNNVVKEADEDET